MKHSVIEAKIWTIFPLGEDVEWEERVEDGTLGCTVIWHAVGAVEEPKETKEAWPKKEAQNVGGLIKQNPYSWGVHELALPGIILFSSTCHRMHDSLSNYYWFIQVTEKWLSITLLRKDNFLIFVVFHNLHLE